MIDTLGLMNGGFYNQDPKSNGIFIYNDASIVFGYKLPGAKFYTMTNEERLSTYTSLRNIINQLDNVIKGTGCVYQFMSTPNYNLDSNLKKSLKLNYLENDPSYKNKPILLRKILDTNIKETFNKFKEEQVVFRDNYIFVRYYFNLAEKNINYFDFIKDIFQLSTIEDEKIKEINDKIEIAIASHNSKFSALHAVPLTLLELMNVSRKYFGFSELKEYPNLFTDDSFVRHLFPGKIDLKSSYIKTQEKIVLNENNKKLDEYNEKKLSENLNKLIEKDMSLIKENNHETQKLNNDLDFIYKDLFNMNPEIVNNYSLYDKYLGFKFEINSVSKTFTESIYKQMSYFNKEKINLYKFEKNYFNNTKREQNDTYLKIFSVSEIPSKLEMFHGDNLNSMYGDFTVTMNFKKLPDNQAMVKMRRQIVLEKIKLDMPVMKWFLPIETIQEKVEILRMMMRNLENEDYSRVETNIYLTLRSHLEKDIREKDIGEYETITKLGWTQEADTAPFHIFTNAMPGSVSQRGMSFSKRLFLLNTTNLAQLSPLISEERGSKNPVFTTVGYKGLIGFDLKQAPAGHLSIQGSTGGGKSVLGNKLVLEYKKAGDNIIITEKGNSFSRSTIFFGGKIYKPDMSGNIKINPFVMPYGSFNNQTNDQDEATKMRKDVYMQMVGAMAQMTNNYSTSARSSYYKLLKNAFESNEGHQNTKFVRKNSITPTKLYKIMLVDSEIRSMKEELNSFRDYTNEGPYGSIFDGNSGLDLNYPIVNIDYSGLSDAGIKDFVFKSLLQNIFNEMSKSQGKKDFFNLNDEFWDAISSSVATGESVAQTAIGQIESFFRVARKLGGKIGVISQGISDIANSPLKSAVLNNIYHSFFTNTASESEKKIIKELFNIEDTQLNQISNLSMVKGSFSEYFALAPYGEKILGNSGNVQRQFMTKFKYYTTPLEIALFTTHPKEVDIYNMMYEILGHKGDPSNVSQDKVMKAVLLFMDILPQGSDSNIHFQETLFKNQENYRFTFQELVEEKYGSIKEAFKILTWESYINKFQ